MKKILKNIIILLVLAIGVSACEKCHEFDDEVEFCSNLNLEDIDKTIPIINEFLATLPEDLNNEQKLQAFTKWLTSYPCIIDATIVCESCHFTMSEIMIYFEENGTTRDLSLIIVMGKTLHVAEYWHYTPMKISVKTKKGFTIDKIFDFINSLDHDVKEIRSGVLKSTMSSDSLQYILDQLNTKPYTNNGDVLKTGGYLHYSTNQIHIFPHLFNMKNVDYQVDWLSSMTEYKLVEDLDFGYTIRFQVSEGTERQWETKFKEYEFVEWAELNYKRVLYTTNYLLGE